jgi:mannose-6-phosphate isomerase
MNDTPILQLVPAYHRRVWGGQNLRPTRPPETPIGEAWLVHEHNRVQGGRFDGQTLEVVASTLGQGLLGSVAFARTGSRFPLLIKLLDCAEWLSVQVHPNNEQAVRLEGPGQFGKTEAWHVLQADADAQVIAGVKPGTTRDHLAHAIRSGGILEVSQYHSVQAGDTIMMPAGTMHALGPGLLIYEVQQTSDITYRVFDWNRPASAGRALHLEQSVAVTDASQSGELHQSSPVQHGAAVRVMCPYFKLEEIKGSLASDTQGSSFHAITVIEGRAELGSHGQGVQLGRFETAIVPASAGAYRVTGDFRALRSSVPEA